MGEVYVGVSKVAQEEAKLVGMLVHIVSPRGKVNMSVGKCSFTHG